MMSMTDGTVGPVIQTLTDGVLTLTLNRPAQRNALSREMIAALSQALSVAAQDTAVRVVVLAGAGPAFCAGHDLREMRGTQERDFYQALFTECGALMQQIVSLPKPVIAQVHGIATAAGCQLVASCDLAIAETGARFATPGVNIGLFCSTPMVALSRAVGRKAALEMLLTGEMIGADTAAAIGLINRAVPPQELSEAVQQLARQIAGKSPEALRIGKQAFQRQADLSLAEAYGYTAGLMADGMMSADANEGIGAFLEKRPPHWPN